MNTQPTPPPLPQQSPQQSPPPLPQQAPPQQYQPQQYQQPVYVQQAQPTQVIVEAPYTFGKFCLQVVTILFIGAVLLLGGCTLLMGGCVAAIDSELKKDASELSTETKIGSPEHLQEQANFYNKVDTYLDNR